MMMMINYTDYKHLAYSYKDDKFFLYLQNKYDAKIIKLVINSNFFYQFLIQQHYIKIMKQLSIVCPFPWDIINIIFKFIININTKDERIRFFIDETYRVFHNLKLIDKYFENIINFCKILNIDYKIYEN